MKTKLAQKNIPEGWGKESLQSLGVKIVDGDRGKNYPNQNDFSKFGYCLFLTATNVSKNGFVFNENQFIDKKKDITMGKGKLYREDLIITTRGTIGNIAYYSKDIPFDHVRINSGMAIIRNSQDLTRLRTEFLLQYFGSALFNKEIKRVSFGSAQPQLTIKIISKLMIPKPEQVNEQDRIITVLETWDKAIENLEKKIEMKKKIKQGLLQQLLTGKIRLRGFTAEWGEFKISELCDLKKGFGLSKEKLCKDGKYKCILYGELYTKYSELIRNVVSKTDLKEGVNSISGDILIPASTTTNALDLAIASCLEESNVLLGGDINILRAKKDYNSRFLSLYLTHAKKHELARLAQGITIVHLYGKDFKKIKIRIPKKKEQTEIAQIITLADEEMSALKKSLLLLKDEKKYLLNKLINGTIRTPKSLEVN